MFAFPNATGLVFTLTQEQIDRGCRAAAESPRKRIILPVHRRQSDPMQRVINFLQPGTYVRPHHHPRPGQVEFIHVLQGRMGILIFDPRGQIEAVHDLSAGPLGVIDLEEGIWHSLVCLEPNTVITEAKMGPYDPQNDKFFAEWAPAESDPAAEDAVSKFLACFQP